MCSASTASGRAPPPGLVARARPLDRLERQQDAAFGVDVEVGVGRRRQLAGLGQPALFGGPVALADGDGADDQRHDEGGGDRHQLRPQPAHAADLAPALGVALGPAGVEERRLGRRQAPAPPLGHPERRLQAHAPVEAAGVAVERVPAGGRLAQVGRGRRCPRGPPPASRAAGATRAAAPRAPPPRSAARLSGWRSRVSSRAWPTARRRRRRTSPALVVAPGRPPRVRRRARRRVGSPRADDHQLLEHAPYAGAGVGRERLVQLLGPRGDGPVDAAELPVGGEGEGAAVAAVGQLRQSVNCSEGRPAGSWSDGPDQLGDQRGLDRGADPRRRARRWPPPARRPSWRRRARWHRPPRCRSARRAAAGRRSRRAASPPPAAGCRAPPGADQRRRGTPAARHRSPG